MHSSSPKGLQVCFSLKIDYWKVELETQLRTPKYIGTRAWLFQTYGRHRNARTRRSTLPPDVSCIFPVLHCKSTHPTIFKLEHAARAGRATFWDMTVGASRICAAQTPGRRKPSDLQLSGTYEFASRNHTDSFTLHTRARSEPGRCG
jgi:hypothetical protein